MLKLKHRIIAIIETVALLAMPKLNAYASQETDNAETKVANYGDFGISFLLQGEANTTTQFWSGKEVESVMVRKTESYDQQVLDLKDLLDGDDTFVSCQYKEYNLSVTNPEQYTREDWENVLKNVIHTTDIPEEDFERLDVNSDGKIRIDDACIIANWYNRFPSTFVLDENEVPMELKTFVAGCDSVFKYYDTFIVKYNTENVENTFAVAKHNDDLIAGQLIIVDGKNNLYVDDELIAVDSVLPYSFIPLAEDGSEISTPLYQPQATTTTTTTTTTSTTTTTTSITTTTAKPTTTTTTSTTTTTTKPTTTTTTSTTTTTAKPTTTTTTSTTTTTTDEIPAETTTTYITLDWDEAYKYVVTGTGIGLDGNTVPYCELIPMLDVYTDWDDDGNEITVEELIYIFAEHDKMGEELTSTADITYWLVEDIQSEDWWSELNTVVDRLDIENYKIVISNEPICYSWVLIEDDDYKKVPTQICNKSDLDKFEYIWMNGTQVYDDSDIAFTWAPGEWFDYKPVVLSTGEITDENGNYYDFIYGIGELEEYSFHPYLRDGHGFDIVSIIPTDENGNAILTFGSDIVEPKHYNTATNATTDTTTETNDLENISELLTLSVTQKKQKESF